MIEIYMSPFFPNQNFGGDYKETLVHRLFLRGEDDFLNEIKSVKITIFNSVNKAYCSIKVINKPEEIWKIATYIFSYIALEDYKKLLAQCNHTFVFNLYSEVHAHVGFSTDDILKEKEFNLYE